MLQAAAVIGTDVPFALLEALAEEPEDQVRRSLTQLQATEFLYETRLFPDLEYTFRHALTHEVAYGSLLQQRRRALHGRIVEAIERLYPDRLNERAEQLAHHAVKGEVWDKAVRYAHQAGAKASSRSAYREAVTYFEQALAGLRRLTETRETLEEAIDLRFELRVALNPLGELGRITEYLEEAEKLAKTLGDHRRLPRVSVYRSFISWQSDRATDARASAQVPQVLAQGLGDFHLEVASILLLERALASAHQWELTFLTPRLMAAVAHAHVMSGRLAEASALLDEPMVKSGAPIQFGCEVLRLLCEVYLAMEQFGQAREFAARALELARDGGIRRVEPRALHLLGNIAMRGEPADVEAGKANFRAALKLAEELGMRPLVAHCHLGLGKLYRRTGKRERAQEHLTTATTMYREMGMTYWLEKAEAAYKAL